MASQHEIEQYEINEQNALWSVQTEDWRVTYFPEHTMFAVNGQLTTPKKMIDMFWNSQNHEIKRLICKALMNDTLLKNHL